MPLRRRQIEAEKWLKYVFCKFVEIIKHICLCVAKIHRFKALYVNCIYISDTIFIKICTINKKNYTQMAFSQLFRVFFGWGPTRSNHFLKDFWRDGYIRVDGKDVVCNCFNILIFVVERFLKYPMKFKYNVKKKEDFLQLLYTK